METLAAHYLREKVSFIARLLCPGSGGISLLKLFNHQVFFFSKLWYDIIPVAGV